MCLSHCFSTVGFYGQPYTNGRVLPESQSLARDESSSIVSVSRVDRCHRSSGNLKATRLHPSALEVMIQPEEQDQARRCSSMVESA